MQTLDETNTSVVFSNMCDERRPPSEIHKEKTISQKKEQDEESQEKDVKIQENTPGRGLRCTEDHPTDLVIGV